MSNTEIHFLNVGHGDCTIIRHPSGRITMVDINNGSELDPSTKEEFAAGNVLTEREAFFRDLFTPKTPSTGFAGLLESLERFGPRAADLTNPIEYFHKYFPGERIFRFILTHPDMDHIRGLAALVESGVAIDNFWDTENEIEKSSFSRAGDEKDWSTYQSIRSGNAGVTVHRPVRLKTGKYWNQDDAGGVGDGMNILAPTAELTAEANLRGDPNAHSIVLHLNAHGTPVFFGGDATQNILDDILVNFGESLRAGIYKAAHHGRDSGYHLGILNAIQPEHTIVSVGKKPETDAQSKYAQQCAKWNGKVLSTRFNGDIVVKITETAIYTVNGEPSRLSPKAIPAFDSDAWLRNFFNH